MPFPPYGSSVPTLAANELSFAGQNFGSLASASAYRLVGISGTDLAPIISGDVQRPLQGGEFAGMDTPGGRDIIVKVNIRGATAAALDSNRLALFAVFQASGRTEQPLYFKTAGGTIYACMARVRKFLAPIDAQSIQAKVVQATVQFKATDWRIYATPTQQVSQTFNDTIGNAVVAVGGSAYASPQILITAGASGCAPVISSSGGSIALDFSSFGMGAGDTLLLDLDYQSAIWTPAGGSPQKALWALYYPAAWGPLAPATTITISAIDHLTGTGRPASTMAIQWANAFPGV